MLVIGIGNRFHGISRKLQITNRLLVDEPTYSTIREKITGTQFIPDYEKEFFGTAMLDNKVNQYDKRNEVEEKSSGIVTTTHPQKGVLL